MPVAVGLRELQLAFARCLREGEAGAEPAGLGPGAGLRVYQNNYRAQLEACLEHSYPGTQAWIGPEAFAAAAAAHITTVPPSSWTLDAYALDFPATLGVLYRNDPEVEELAWLELALSEAFIGPDANALDLALAADLDWDRAVVRFTPTLDLRLIRTNAAAIWSAISASETPPPAAELDQPAGLLVWRSNLISCFRQTDRQEYETLLLARAGTPFSAICAHLVAEAGEDEGIGLAGAWLGQWLSDGLVARIDRA